MCKSLLYLEYDGTCLLLQAETAVTHVKVFTIVSAVLSGFQWGKGLD